jgi:ketosteroid isomerase-like protein
MPGPIDTVNELVKAINGADLERAVGAYESGALLVVQPGQVVRGSAQLRKALAGFIALRAVLRSEAQQLIEAEGVALYIGRWSLSGTDPAGNAVTMGGESTDVLRRQGDGRWLIALDNPWGARILPPYGEDHEDNV